jgi:hypothetical protein
MLVIRSLHLAAQIAIAGTSGASPEPQPSSSGWGPGRNQIGLEAGILSGGVSYARRVGAGRLALGGGLWYAWEPEHSFNRNVWETFSVTGFARYWLPPVVQLEAGPALVRYLWSDDCSDCTGTFGGLRMAARAGYRHLFIGPALWLGWAADRNNPSQFGAILDLQLTVAFGWGR